MTRRRAVDIELLFALWADHSLTRVEVARRLGISDSHLTRMLRLYRVPPRPFTRCRRADAVAQDEEAASRDSLAIAPGLRAAAEAVKQRHYAERRGEAACCGTSHDA